MCSPSARTMEEGLECSALNNPRLYSMIETILKLLPEQKDKKFPL